MVFYPRKLIKEVKSTDKDALKIREKLFNSSKILGNIDLIGIFQLKESMNFKYYGDTVHKQEQIFYKELFETLLLDILGEYKQEDIELHMILELDKNNKIEREFYENLRKEMMKLFNLKVFDIESAGSNNSFGLQLADQITGICREYIKENKYIDFIDKFKILNVNPLSKN